MADHYRFFIGNQTACSAPVTEPFALALAHGFDAFELFPDRGQHGRGWMAEDLSAADRRAFRTDAHERDLRLSVHAALAVALRHASGRALLTRDLDLARDVGAALLNLHLEPTHTPPELDAYARAVLDLVDHLAPSGITLALENTVTASPEEVNRVFARLQALDSERARGVGLCLDIGHANLHLGTHNDYLAFVDRLAPEVPIVHAHLHENWGESDRHLPLFTGPAGRDASGIVGLLSRLRARRYHGSLILEQWPAPPTLLVAARDRLRALQAGA
jgi:sugar phosphate isomerase/epimerase